MLGDWQNLNIHVKQLAEMMEGTKTRMAPRKDGQQSSKRQISDEEFGSFIADAYKAFLEKNKRTDLLETK
uniref:Uncharacterized protein n=1 Tax=Peronospora matthiolae TaxID=2874970 RepID=A0AAV1TNB1_9STRA